MPLSHDLSTTNLILEFLRIKALGFVASSRIHNTGIGKTFEDLLGKKEDNKKDADFEGIEVKSQRQAAASYITLFTKSPSFPNGANTILRDLFGEPIGGTGSLIKKLHTSVFGNRFNTYRGKYGFTLSVNKEKQTVCFVVKDLATNDIISDNIGWSFNDLKKASNKINTLFVVWADKKIKEDIEHFHYTRAKIYHTFKMDKFVDAIISGGIMVDIRIGTYSSGPNIGKPHDHGTGFRVKREFLENLFEDYEDVS